MARVPFYGLELSPVVAGLAAGYDPIPEVTVRLRLPVGQVRLLTIGRRGQVLPVEPVANGGRIMLKDIEPWGMRCVLM